MNFYNYKHILGYNSKKRFFTLNTLTSLEKFSTKCPVLTCRPRIMTRLMSVNISRLVPTLQNLVTKSLFSKEIWLLLFLELTTRY